MEISYQEVGNISADGKVTIERIPKAQWRGCICIYPGTSFDCHCEGDCPCNKVSANRHQQTDAWDEPFK